MKFAPMPKDTDVKCLNCGSMINTSNTYCHNCGQKIKEYNLSAWKLITEMFASVFNLDSKFAKTIINIWRPVNLTKAYVRGERKRFLNPGRLFIVSFFILSALFSFFMKNNSSFDNDVSKKDLFASAFKDEFITEFDSLAQLYKLQPEAQVDSLRNNLFLSKKHMEADSIDSPPAIFHFSTESGVESDSDSVKGAYKIATKDILELNKEDLFDKYEVKGFKDQVFLIQYLKFRENPDTWSIFMVTNCLWAIVLSTFILALFMKLLYIRRSYFYAEHLVLLMTFQSLIFIMFIFSLLLSYIDNQLLTKLLPFVAGIGSIWFVVSLKQYYDQSLFKTLIKSFLIFMVHILILSVCLMVVVGVSFLLY